MKKWLAAGVVTLALPVAALPVVAGASTAASASPVRASAACTAGAACTRGAWQVMPASGQIRAARAVLMYNGNVLLVTSSGGGNILFTKPATRLTDLINLSDPATAHYTPGPPLLRGPEI
ncbi:MAG TPA: hypothetical protein VKG80_04180, partial [Trebonia sp.]|nr:hypothetical protein [Trebonia sp.]